MNWNSKAQFQSSDYFGKCVAVGLLIFGLAILSDVVTALWGLFSDPQSVLALSEILENQSGLNETFSSWVSEVLDYYEVVPDGISESTEHGKPGKPLNISFIFSWLISIFVLTLISRVGYWATNTAISLLYLGSNVSKNPRKSPPIR